MQVKIPRAGALEMIQAAQAVTSGSSRADVSSSQNVLLEAGEDGQLRLSVTDYETSMRAVVPGEALAPGQVVVPVDRLADILKESAAEEAELVADGAHLIIRLTGAEYKVFGATTDDFPEMPTPDPSGGVEIPAATLRQMLQRTRYSAASERSRYTLNSVRWEQLEDGKLRIIGCDGHRLALMDQEVTGTLGEPALIPMKAIAVIEKVLAAAPAEAIAICKAHENRLDIQVGEAVLGTLALEGAYPDYSSVIRDEGEHPVVIDPTVMARVVRQAALCVDKASKTVRVAMHDGRMVFSATSAGAGGGEAKVEMATSYAGPDVEILFNPDFVLEILKAAGGEAVTLDLVGSTSAARMGAENWLNIVMPVQV